MKKRIVSIILCVVMLFTTATISAFAAENIYTYDNYKYQFSLNFPSKYENPIYIKFDGDYYDIFARRIEIIHISSQFAGCGGEIFSIIALSLNNELDVTHLEHIKDTPGVSEIDRNDQFVYLLHLPTDVQFSEETQKEYMEIYNALIEENHLKSGVFSIWNPKSPFNDVKTVDWYYSAVMYTYENKLFEGLGNNTFAPGGTTTRAMFVTVLARLAGVDVSGYISSDFDDVKVDTWYSKYVKWAHDTGLVNGYGDGRFGPEDEISRAQMAKLIACYINSSSVSLIPVNSTTWTFGDIDKVPDWALEYVEQLRIADLLRGDQNGNFNPNNSTTRAEAATVIMRLDQAIQGDQY